MLSKLDLCQYQTFIFDCDGVLLNSNKIKTEAFYKVAKVYGKEAAKELQKYHILNGGISRYEKFKYLFLNILKRPVEKLELDKLIFNYSIEVRLGLMSCEIAKNIEKLRTRTKHSKWLVVSGGDQEELRELFKKRGLINFFNVGIFGSPDSKDAILKNEKNNGNISGKTLFIGDSMYDAKAAENANIDFIFLTKWTEVVNWENAFSTDQIFKDISSLLNK